ncbi:hypothetical protein BASA81_005530 [Batrachochytrium salamandrivorans]|nr:hypothetical protein BASA81_005530 [Batrachochytrium salamandrivorans]
MSREEAKQMAQIKAELEEIYSQLQVLMAEKNGALFLYPLQVRLREVDSWRTGGKFMCGSDQIPPGQAQLVELLEDCYGLVYKVRNGMQAVEDELTSVREDLTFLLNRDKHVQYVQLAPLQDRLLQVSQRLSDGKFTSESGDVPPGQAKLFDLIHECYEIKNQLVDRMEAKQS